MFFEKASHKQYAQSICGFSSKRVNFTTFCARFRSFVFPQCKTCKLTAEVNFYSVFGRLIIIPKE